MKMNNFIKIFLIILLLANFNYAGGGKRNGTGGANELLIPVGVRGIALSGSNISNSFGIESLHWNPAGLSKTSHSVEATFSYMSHIADIGVNYGAVAANVPELGIFSFSIKALNVGEIPVTTNANPDGTGQTFSPQFLTLGLTFARNLSDKISVGLTANLISERMDLVSAMGVAFNIGVMYEHLASINGLSFGVVLKNLGPQMKFDGSGLLNNAVTPQFNRPGEYYKIDAAGFELPSSLELGLSYQPQIDEENALLITSSFQSNNFSGDEYKIGAEYGYSNTFFIRGGYSAAPELESENYLYGLTAGIGLNYEPQKGINLRFDYAYRDVKVFDSNHVFALTVGF